MTNEEERLISLFQQKVNKRSHDECWEWLGKLDRYGLGWFREGRLHIEARVLSWLIFFGNIPDGKQVVRMCGSLECVNPYHLCLEDEKLPTPSRLRPEPKPLPDNFHSLKPGTENWREFWKEHPEKQGEMLEFRECRPFVQNMNIEEAHG